jgi:hypothetical protein
MGRRKKDDLEEAEVISVIAKSIDRYKSVDDEPFLILLFLYQSTVQPGKQAGRDDYIT